MEINVDGVCAAYGRRRVLHGVDWVVRPGVTGLLGPNGSGKTTLLSVLVGLLRPTEGTVTVHSGAAGGSTQAGDGDGDGGRVGGGARFGFVPQRWSVLGAMRVAEAVEYTAWGTDVPRRDCTDAAHRAVRAVGLADKARDRVRTLSGGQRQRLGIAAGLANDPEVLVLDEPTVGLDPDQRWRVRDLIAELGRTRTVLLSTHLLDEVSHLCQRVGVLAQGRLVFDGPVTDLEVHDTDRDRDGDGGGVERRSPIERGYKRLLETVGGTE